VLEALNWASMCELEGDELETQYATSILADLAKEPWYAEYNLQFTAIVFSNYTHIILLNSSL
jgi:hypothetical protein